MPDHTTADVVDPFDTVDEHNTDNSLGLILSERFNGTYYREVLNWFFDAMTVKEADTWDSVVEVGSGTGHPLNLLAEKLSSSVDLRGVDKSSTLVRLACEYFPELSFTHADGTGLPIPDNSVDCTYIATVLVHVPAPLP
jgi:ubiquinone/menaquinone biosynthesis C-methylase UbiE